MSLCTVSGNLKTILGANSGPGTVRFTLTNLGTGNTPIVSGTGALVPLTTDVTVDATGAFSVALQGNDTITPSNTLYAVTFYAPNGAIGPNLYSVTGSTFNLNTALTTSSAPPVVYNNLDANLAFTGNNTFAGTTALNGGGSFAGTFTGNPTLSGNVAFTGNNTHSGTETFANINNILYVDGTTYSTSDIGAGINAAIAALPTLTISGTSYPYGTIELPPGRYNLATAVVQPCTVSIKGPGITASQITSSVNGNVWTFGEKTAFNDTRCGSLGGFTLIDSSGGANAVGLLTGDVNGAHFHDLGFIGFTGANSSCIYMNNSLGWSERNEFENIHLGEANNASGDSTTGCTKAVRFNVTGSGNSSFGYNTWIGVHMSPRTGQTGWSVEGTSSLYSNYIQGNANVQNASTLFDVQAGGSLNFINFPIECTGCSTGATRWNVASGKTFSYSGPGINTADPTHFSDSVSGTLTRVLVSPTLTTGNQGLILYPTSIANGNPITLAITNPSSAYTLTIPGLTSNASMAVTGISQDVSFGSASMGSGAVIASSGVTCTMVSATTCTQTVPYSGGHCRATVRGTTAYYAACDVSGTTATVTANASNSATWDIVETK